MLFDDAVLVGKIKKYNSYKGEHVILCNDSTAVDKENKFLILELDGLKVPFLIEESATKSNDTVNVRLKEIKNENEAKSIVGASVYFPREAFEDCESSNLPSASYLTGFYVYDKTEGFLGTITGIDDSSINTLLYIKGTKEIIIPFNEDFLVSFNPRKRTLKLDLPEGLTSIN